MISVQNRRIDGNALPTTNRLPMFRDPHHSKTLDGSLLLEEEREGYGYETGSRFLPYLWQDGFDRRSLDVEIKTIVLENGHLRAEFWPDYGMRLMSLYSKKEERELLFNNPVLRFADLAIRKAWFSGGIEWNLGQLGHAFTTCVPLFVARVDDNTLRAWEYERCKGLYWAMDFHLEEDDDFLSVHVRAVNVKKEAVPFYWWTNVAVPEEPGVRVFSGTDEIIYIDRSSLMKDSAGRLMAHGRLPYIDRLEKGRDYSYPSAFSEYSNEYFFQNDKTVDQCWEAAAYSDGSLFFERSSSQLWSRKMFCWGGQQGGRHWRDFLSSPGKGDYVELQAGFACTQMHGLDIPPETEWDFVQFFSGTVTDTSFDGEWKSERDRIYSIVDEMIPSSLVEERLARYRQDAHKPIESFLSYGSGWGALEEKRGCHMAPSGFVFPEDSITGESAFWLSILEGNADECDDIPPSFITDPDWKPVLENFEDSPTKYKLLGVMLLENGLVDEAEEAFKKALSYGESPFVLRCLACIEVQRGNIEAALEYISACCALTTEREYAQEYLELLCKAERFDAAWAYYSSLPSGLQDNEHLCLAVLPAALSLEKMDFLAGIYSREIGIIREGSRLYSDGWFVYQAMKEAGEKGLAMSEELVEKHRREDHMPFFIDFRQG